MGALAVSPNGRYLVSSGNDRIVNVWEREEMRWGGGRPELHRPLRSVTSVSFAPDGQSVISVGGGDAIYVWKFCGDTSADEDALVGESLRLAESRRKAALAAQAQLVTPHARRCPPPRSSPPGALPTTTTTTTTPTSRAG